MYKRQGLTVSNPGTYPVAGKGTLALNANGTYTFTPVAGFTGPVDYTYTTCSNTTPQDCDTATLHILVGKAPVPDLTPTIQVIPSQVVGSRTLNVRIMVQEILNVATDPTKAVYVLIPTSPHYTLASFNPTLSLLSGLPVVNSAWSYLGVSGSNYVFKLGGVSAITSIGALASSIFGFTINYTCLLYTSPSPRD